MTEVGKFFNGADSLMLTLTEDIKPGYFNAQFTYLSQYYMIQRIQTLFLAGVAIISVALFYVPLSEKLVNDPVTTTQSKQVLYVHNLMKDSGETATVVQSSIPLLMVNLLVLAASVFIIFQYKNRMVQLKLCMLTGLFTIVLMILAFYYSEEMGSADTRAHYLAGIYLIAAQVFLLLAARRAIRKDEMLVRSADRIR